MPEFGEQPAAGPTGTIHYLAPGRVLPSNTSGLPPLRVTHDCDFSHLPVWIQVGLVDQRRHMTSLSQRLRNTTGSGTL
jgi:hypothetical protein